MIQHLRANLWLVILTLLICCVAYPLVLLGIGQAVFTDKAQGSLIVDRAGKTIGSRTHRATIYQRSVFPAAAIRRIVQRRRFEREQFRSEQLPVARPRRAAIRADREVRGRRKKGKPVGPDIEAWFDETDRTKAKDAPGVLSQWATAHPSAAQNWVKNADKSLSDYITDWQKTHSKEVADWIKDNPTTPQPPQPSDLAVPFFKSFSSEHPGKFPSAVDHPAANGKTEKKIDPVSSGSDVQSALFDMWLQAHPDANLEQVPGDMVTTSCSGLDPDITLDNAEYQLDRVAGEWAKKLNREDGPVRKEVEAMLQEKASAPLDGLVGVKLINVLEMNVALTNRYEPIAPAAK